MNKEGDKKHFEQSTFQPSTAMAASLRTLGIAQAKPDTSYLAGKHEASKEKWNCILIPQDLFSILISASSLFLIHYRRPDCFLFPRVLSSTPALPYSHTHAQFSRDHQLNWSCTQFSSVWQVEDKSVAYYKCGNQAGSRGQMGSSLELKGSQR